MCVASDLCIYGVVRTGLELLSMIPSTVCRLC